MTCNIKGAIRPAVRGLHLSVWHGDAFTVALNGVPVT